MSVREFEYLGSSNKVNVVLGTITHFEEHNDGGTRLYLSNGTELDVNATARSIRGYVKKALAPAEAKAEAVEEAA